MSTVERTDKQRKECVIVGGGIHGSYLARELLDSGIAGDELTIVDPQDELLDSFREKAHACGMDALRSSFVQHLGTEPFGLKEFAKANGREDELVATVDYPERPSLSLFLDHAEAVIDSRGIDSLHRQATVEVIERDGEEYRVETTAGSLRTANVALAIGRGGRYRYPEWAAIEGVTHVWDGFDPIVGGETIVVGGGITAVTLACTLAEQGSVTLLTRHALEWAVAETAPPWINWSHIEANLHPEPPGSEARFDIVQEARHSTTIPPYLYHELDRLLEDGVLYNGEVSHGNRSYHVPCDDTGRTPVEGVYAAGRLAGTEHQALVAAGSGARAGMAVIRDAMADRGFPEQFLDRYHDWTVHPHRYEDWDFDDWFERQMPDGVEDERFQQLKQRYETRIDGRVRDEEQQSQQQKRGDRLLREYLLAEPPSN